MLITFTYVLHLHMYLIHFHSKNIIKMHFHFFVLFQSHYRHLLSIATRWNKLCWHQQRLHYSLWLGYLKKNYINNYNNYSSKFWGFLLKKFFLNKWKAKLKIRQRGVVVCAILNRVVVFFFSSEINWDPVVVFG